MKKYILKVIAVMGIILSLFSLFACTKNNKIDRNEMTVNFSSLTQEDKQSFVKSYIQDNYSLNCQLTEITKKKISAIENEENYYTVATTNDGFWFSVWITPEEKVIDTAFTYELKESVNDYIENLLSNNGINCKVIDRFIFEQPASKIWNKTEIEEMFNAERISNIIHLYGVNSDLNNYQVIIALKDLNGAVYVHYKQFNPDEPDFENYDQFIDLD